jgi:hypothetical protein
MASRKIDVTIEMNFHANDGNCTSAFRIINILNFLHILF